MPRKHGRRKKRKTHIRSATEDEATGGAGVQDNIPRSFVIRRGQVPSNVKTLIREMRLAFLPHTASRLKEQKSNKLKDYLSISGKLGITHMWMLSSTDLGAYVRVGRLPRGPTLTFRLKEYTLQHEVKDIQRRPVALVSDDFRDPPLLVLNHFSSDEPQVKIMKAIFENMFPKFDIRTARLSNIRRVLLMDYDEETQTVHMRHYKIMIQPVGLSRPLRRLVVRHKVPKLSNMNDISEWIDGQHDGAYSSESEGEGPAENHVTLPQDVGKRKKKGAKNSVKLVEQGPRISMELIKVENGFCEGEVLFHSLHQKTKEEADDTAKEVAEKAKLKQGRRNVQEAAVETKKRKLESKRENKRLKKVRRVEGLAEQSGEKGSVAKGDDGYEPDD